MSDYAPRSGVTVTVVLDCGHTIEAELLSGDGLKQISATMVQAAAALPGHLALKAAAHKCSRQDDED